LFTFEAQRRVSQFRTDVREANDIERGGVGRHAVLFKLCSLVGCCMSRLL